MGWLIIHRKTFCHYLQREIQIGHCLKSLLNRLALKRKTLSVMICFCIIVCREPSGGRIKNLFHPHVWMICSVHLPPWKDCSVRRIMDQLQCIVWWIMKKSEAEQSRELRQHSWKIHFFVSIWDLEGLTKNIWWHWLEVLWFLRIMHMHFIRTIRIRQIWPIIRYWTRELSLNLMQTRNTVQMQYQQRYLRSCVQKPVYHIRLL